MFNKTFSFLVVVGAVLASIPAQCFAGWNEKFEARCAAMNATFNGGDRCVCKPGFTESNNTCVPNGSSSSSGGSSSSGRDYEAERRAEEQAEAARRAEAERQAELERQRRAEDERRRQEEAQRQAKFLEDRDAAAGTLRGSTGNSVSSSVGLRGSTVTSGNSGLRGSSADSGLRGLKTGTTVTPNIDPMVVDARNVPSGLDKATENAIAKAYPNATNGVSDRVRKGFQAVMERDWKVAKAWFQDALNRDPDNAGLKRLVALTDYTYIRTGQASGKPSTDEDIPPDADKKTYALTSTKVHSQRAWTKFLFPDANKLSKVTPGRSAQTAGNKVQVPLDSDIEFLSDGNQVQLPLDSDIEFLFGPNTAPAKSSVSNNKNQPHN